LTLSTNHVPIPLIRKKFQGKPVGIRR